MSLEVIEQRPEACLPQTAQTNRCAEWLGQLTDSVTEQCTGIAYGSVLRHFTLPPKPPPLVCEMGSTTAPTAYVCVRGELMHETQHSCRHTVTPQWLIDMTRLNHRNQIRLQVKNSRMWTTSCGSMNVFLQRATEVPSNSFDLISGLKAAVKCGSTPAVGPQHLAEGTNLVRCTVWRLLWHPHREPGSWQVVVEMTNSLWYTMKNVITSPYPFSKTYSFKRYFFVPMF